MYHKSESYSSNYIELRFLKVSGFFPSITFSLWILNEFIKKAHYINILIIYEDLKTPIFSNVR